MNRQLVGGAIHAPPAELAQSTFSRWLTSFGHSHLKPHTGQGLETLGDDSEHTETTRTNRVD
jgi:hypothetical protein